MFEQDQWFYMMQCSDLDQQSHRKWCYDTNQRCSISTMPQTTMMLWFWSTMSRMMMMFQYWSMMLQTMINFRLHNLAKRMKTRFKDTNTWSKKWHWNQRRWKWKKGRAIVKKRNELNFNYSELQLAVSPQTLLPNKGLNTCNTLMVKWSTQSMTETGIQCPLSRVTGPCLG